VCAELGAGLLEREAPSLKGRHWESIVAVSNDHHVAPALGWCLLRRSGIPPSVRDYFETVHALSRERNEAILAALRRVVAALNAIGVEPVALKGVAHLLDQLYPPGVRLVGDADLLVRDGPAAAACLTASGFVTLETDLKETHHHLPMMQDPISGLVIELHTRVEYEAEEGILPVAWFLEQTRLVPFDGLKVRIPDATRMAGHCIVHAQLHDYGFLRRRLELRQLLDLAMLRARYGPTIDWRELDGAFAKAGRGEALAAYLSLNAALFDQELLPLVCRPRRLSARELRDYVDPPPRRPEPDVDAVSYRLVPTQIMPESGHCWCVELPPELLPGDSEGEAEASTLQVLEDGVRLGPAHVPHDMIRTWGQGAYCHWQRHLYFSSSDNTDPRSSGRSYRVKGPVLQSANVLARPLVPPGVDAVSFALPCDRMVHEAGYCWQIDLPAEFLPGDSASAPRASGLQLFEDGVPLGPAHAPHDVIRHQGRGSFSHWERALHFSSSDNRDPRSSGRTYQVTAWIPQDADLLAVLAAGRAQLAAARAELAALEKTITWRLRARLKRHAVLYRALTWCVAALVRLRRR
jgi:hypothetical protein